MTILIANLGTSDLAIKIGDIYLPLEFRDEKNLDKSELSNELLETWKQRNTIIFEEVCQPLKVERYFNKKSQKEENSFRNLTEAIWQSYQKDEPPSYGQKIHTVKNSNWTDCLRPVRIEEIIKVAVDQFEVEQIYFFVTNQNPPHPQDTIHLVKILEKWLKQKYPTLIIHPVDVSQSVNVVKPDELTNYYYNFFQENIQQPEDTLLVSVKGGTPQMQTALQMQTIASGVQKQLFLTPKLVLKNILEGKPSDCEFASNWRYIKSQKYRTIQLLLDRWDFDGANKVVEDWQKTLEFLSQPDYDIPDKNQAIATLKTVEMISIGLRVALSTFNFDLQMSRTLVNFDQEDPEKLDLSKQITWTQDLSEAKYNSVLNLYTQCRISLELEQIANFFSRFGSFYEEILHTLFIQLDSEKFFDENYKPNWSLRTERFQSNEEQALLNQFLNREEELKNALVANFNRNWRYHQLKGRFSKRNFAEALVICRKPKKKQYWQAIQASFDKLDYWFDQRNAVTHGAKGISKERLDDILERDRKNTPPTQSNATQGSPHQACEGKEILEEMTTIYQNLEKILDWEKSLYVGQDAPYYIYSEAKDWVKQQLDSKEKDVRPSAGNS